MSSEMLLGDFTTNLVIAVAVFAFLFGLGLLFMLIRLYRKVEQGTAIVRNGMGGTKVSFDGMLLFPILHRGELMDISVKRIEIDRQRRRWLDLQRQYSCRHQSRILCPCQQGRSQCCQRSPNSSVVSAPRAKLLWSICSNPNFPKRLKTVGKQFDFVDLYNSREEFRDEILKIIGTDLNGYVLDDAAIDYLEQTDLEKLNPNNVLDCRRYQKDYRSDVAREVTLANHIRREKEKTITKQDVEAREAILELERQQAEAEEKQNPRSIAKSGSRQRRRSRDRCPSRNATFRNRPHCNRRRNSVAEENKLRQSLLPTKAKNEPTLSKPNAWKKNAASKSTERERVVTLAEIEKEKAVEVEKKIIQDVIRERVMVERAVVEEEEKIKDTREFATADRSKQVAVTGAEEIAQQELVKQVKAAEAGKQAADFEAETIVVTRRSG